MFKAIISSKKYWISVIFIGLVFILILLIFSIIKHVMQYGGLGIDSFINDNINNGKWVRYFISRIVGGLMYGMIMAYYFELRKRKSKR